MEAEIKLKNIDKYLKDLACLKEELVDVIDCIDELEKSFIEKQDKFIININNQAKTPLELTHYIKEQLVQYLKEKKISSS